MRRTLAFQLFLAVLAVSLATVTAVVMIVRRVFTTAFIAYLDVFRPEMVERMPMRHAGRFSASGPERAFSVAMDQGMVLGALAAVMMAVVAGVLIARWLGGPLGRLTGAARSLAAGGLDHRVEPEGPVELIELGTAFNEMADSLETAEVLRRRLVADVAHELRNPVAALRAQAEGMAEGVLDPGPERLASVVEDLAHLSRLVDDLQELSVAEAGQLAYDMTVLDLAGLVVREADRAKGSLLEGVSMAVEGGEGLPTVMGDEFRLTQVVRNLLANAVRHTREGSVRVRLSCGGGMVGVEVVDTGEGIPEEDLPLIFERFYRADGSRERSSGGVGLGLAISRRIVEDHGGEVFATSSEGDGATVGFKLPAMED